MPQLQAVDGAERLAAEKATAALHEAGHTAIALLFGLRMRRVWITGVGNGWTKYFTEGAAAPDPASGIPIEALVCVAGSAAECRDAGLAPRWRRGSAGDASGLAAEHGLTGWTERAFGRVDELFRGKVLWAQVEALRDELLRHEVLYGTMAERLCRRVARRFRQPLTARINRSV